MSESLARLSAALADRYRIERELGAGGMATVYLAHDVRHDRKVALKLLKPELAAVLGADRFVQEIRTTAALQHPHILPLFDSGTADGFLYYVMPFIQGETLRGKLDRETQLGVDEAVKLTTAVADALDYAHRHGVIHRDIKPENILLHDGRPMVADFGIALAVSAAAGGRMTETGLSLGTPHYMSPEQATAEKDISARSDIYSLGSVLYEMLAGQPPHLGGSAQQIIMKIITEPAPPLVQLRKSVPPNVAAAVATSLEKLPADRFESARSFAEALSNPHFAGDHGTVVGAASRSDTAWQRRAAMLGVSTVVATAAALWGWSRSVPPTLAQPPSRLVLQTPGLASLSDEVAHIALTPDGGALVYGAVVDGKEVTLLRPLYASDAVAIPGAPFLGAYQISADGRELAGFPEIGPLVRYPLRGGSGGALPALFGTGKIPEALSGAYGADSGDDAYWISTADSAMRVSLADGSVSRAVATQRDSLLIQQVLPGNRLAVAIQPAALNRMRAVVGAAFLIDLETGRTTMLVDARVAKIRYTSGYLVYVLDNGAIEARPFDFARRAKPGDPTPIASDVSLDNTTAHFAVASNGTLAYVPAAPRSLVLIDRSGTRRSLEAEPRLYNRAQFSPDGARIALDFGTADGQDIWILTLSDSTLSRATIDRFGTSPNWSSDGRSLIYASLRMSVSGAIVFRVPVGRPEAAESLFTSQQLRGCCLSLPDGGLVVAAYGLSRSSNYDIGIVRSGEKRTVVPVVATRFDERNPALTRDGRWLAYQSNQSGRDEVYVQSLDGLSGQLQVSTDGGTEPVWRADGRELFYRGSTGRGGTDQLMVATVETRAVPRVTLRRPLFSVADIMVGDGETGYDVSPDGLRFVMVQRNRPTQVVVIQNLPALVRQLEGAGRRVP